MPISLARMTAHIFELLPKPLITNDQLRLLKYDNVLSGKYKNNNDFEFNCSSRFEEVVNKNSRKNLRRGKFKSLIIEKDFEPENPKQLEELDENSCKWPIGHPNEDNFYFCGRNSLKDFSYCKLHLLYAFQPKNRKEDVLDKDKENEVPKFIKRKIKSA